VGNFVTDDGATGAVLTNNHRVNAVSFTGGVETGPKFGRTAGGRTKPVMRELGGKSPKIMYPYANMKAASRLR
jgi:betaine-aldehyde dehydrogenase